MVFAGHRRDVPEQGCGVPIKGNFDFALYERELMNSLFYSALLALAAVPALAWGGDESSNSPASPPLSASLSMPRRQAELPPPQIGTESAPGGGVLLDNQPGFNADEPWALADSRACCRPSC